MRNVAWFVLGMRKACGMASLGIFLLAACGRAGSPGRATVNRMSGTLSGAPAGVKVSLSGALRATTTTDGAGSYAFAGLADGRYAITPYLYGYGFTPAIRAVTWGGGGAGGRAL